MTRPGVPEPLSGASGSDIPSAAAAGLPPCRRCLLDEVPDGADIAARIRRLIDALPEGKRVDKETTNRRLDVCRQCDHLFGGTCALCGCYVEMRAAGKNASCPDVPDRWRRGARKG